MHLIPRVALLSALLTLAVAGVARADFTVQTCNGKPAAPWVEQLNAPSGFTAAADGCSQVGGAYTFNLGGALQIAPKANPGAGVLIPAGEALTGVTMSLHSLDTTGGSAAYIGVGYDETAASVSQIGDDHTGQQLAFAAPDASSLFLNVYCSGTGGQPCDFGSTNIVSVGELDFRLHDTGVPAVHPLGGSLATRGVYKGLQTVAYAATDAGSGVSSVTASLGSVVVGAAQGACQSFSLRPCPAQASGTIAADTRLVADGAYPVILTAYDASGDGTPVQVGTITVRNHSGAQSLPSGGRRRVHAQVKITWKWSPARTLLSKLTIRRLPRNATASMSCAGRGCPFSTRRTGYRHLRRFVRGLTGRVFHAGQRLTVRVSAPHRRSQQARLLIRRNALPKLLRR